MQELPDEGVEARTKWFEQNLPFPGGLIGLELTDKMARVRLVVGDQLALDRVQVFLCTLDPIVNRGEWNVARNVRIGHPLPWRAMPDERPNGKTEQTRKGLTVPIPKRGEFFANLKKIARPKANGSTTSARGAKK